MALVIQEARWRLIPTRRDKIKVVIGIDGLRVYDSIVVARADHLDMKLGFNAWKEALTEGRKAAYNTILEKWQHDKSRIAQSN